jgi:hypothetical protein
VETTTTPTTENLKSQEKPDSTSTSSEEPTALSAIEVPAKKEEAPAVEEYELSLGENSILSEEDLDAIVKIAEEKNLTKEQAEALLADTEASYKKGYDKFQTKYISENNAARAKLIADPDFATPEKSTENLGKIAKVVEMFGGEHKEGMIELLKSPAGNSLALAKFLINIAKAGESDTPQGKGFAGDKPEASSKAEALKKMYPSFYK